MKVTGKLAIGGVWLSGRGESFTSVDPATGDALYQGRMADPGDEAAAVLAARGAAEVWAAWPSDDRIGVLRAFQKGLCAARDGLAELISRETGKPRWESVDEVGAMSAKVDISIRAWEARCAPYAGRADGLAWSTRYRPHGVVAVLGPFNFPGHLPNGHIVPALLAGNAVVFKPSERTPAVGEAYVRLWEQAGLPSGALNLVQGGAAVGAALAGHADVAGVFFTGSHAAGQALHRLLAGHPEKLLALEMGGNNPLVIGRTAQGEAAVYLVAVSAFGTTGQRCTCARRLILIEPEVATGFLPRLVATARRLRQGAWDSRPEPFMGPLIDARAAAAVVAAQERWLAFGARLLLKAEIRPDGPAFVSPGIVDTTGIAVDDDEIFGPLLQVIRVPTLDAAIREANRTAYGLSAAYVGDDPAAWEQFRDRVRAGVVNWNRQTTGARSDLPFGGIGRSGNHRPSAWFAADYCAWPMATIAQTALALPETLPPGFTLSGEAP